MLFSIDSMFFCFMFCQLLREFMFILSIVRIFSSRFSLLSTPKFSVFVVFLSLSVMLVSLSFGAWFELAGCCCCCCCCCRGAQFGGGGGAAFLFGIFAFAFALAGASHEELPQLLFSP